MQKKCQVHMLPTDKHTPYIKANDLFIDRDSKKLSTSQQNHHDISVLSYWTPHDIYFTNDEEIKEGDWCINKNGDTLYHIKTILSNIDDRVNWSKVVATTNPELQWIQSYSYGDKGKNGIVAKIPLDFVEVFVKAYNEGTPIKEVMVEIIDWTDKPKSLHHTMEESTWGSNNVGKLKLTPDGSVITHFVEEKLYTLQEISDLLETEAYDNYLLYLLDNNKCSDKRSKNYVSFKNWFNKNI